MSKLTNRTRGERLFPGFFLGGFECSTMVNQNGTRVDEQKWTRHDSFADADFRRLKKLGIHTVREGVRWSHVDNRGSLDFASAIPLIHAAIANDMVVIWDLFH